MRTSHLFSFLQVESSKHSINEKYMKLKNSRVWQTHTSSWSIKAKAAVMLLMVAESSSYSLCRRSRSRRRGTNSSLAAFSTLSSLRENHVLNLFIMLNIFIQANHLNFIQACKPMNFGLAHIHQHSHVILQLRQNFSGAKACRRLQLYNEFIKMYKNNALWRNWVAQCIKSMRCECAVYALWMRCECGVTRSVISDLLSALAIYGADLIERNGRGNAAAHIDNHLKTYN